MFSKPSSEYECGLEVMNLAYLFEMPDYLTVLCYSIGLTIQYIIGTIFLYKIIK